MTRDTKRTTGIEWTEHTWNPFVGCSIHTAGCTNCYAMRQAERIARMTANSVYQGTVKLARNGSPVWTGTIRKATRQTWQKPLKVREPSMFFVNSMSDFFHESAPDAWRSEALQVMASTPHQYQVLTKRPENIHGYVARTGVSFPRNVWLGVTLERADFRFRLDLLREVRAAVRFISAEPLLGPLGPLDLAGIHWVIVGGESGPGARPMRVEWVRELVGQCVEQGVAVFFKQWGIAKNNPLYYDTAARRAALDASRPGTERMPRLSPLEWVETFDPIGKGGSKLDGVEWKQYPAFEVQPALL